MIITFVGPVSEDFPLSVFELLKSYVSISTILKEGVTSTVLRMIFYCMLSDSGFTELEKKVEEKISEQRSGWILERVSGYLPSNKVSIPAIQFVKRKDGQSVYRVNGHFAKFLSLHSELRQHLIRGDVNDVQLVFDQRRDEEMSFSDQIKISNTQSEGFQFNVYKYFAEIMPSIGDSCQDPRLLYIDLVRGERGCRAEYYFLPSEKSALLPRV